VQVLLEYQFEEECEHCIRRGVVKWLLLKIHKVQLWQLVDHCLFFLILIKVLRGKPHELPVVKKRSKCVSDASNE